MKTSLVLRVFVPLALGYCVVSILRSINAVIAPYLVGDLYLSATELGFATSIFFLTAVLMQIPYGVLLDRYDPRKLYAVVLSLCAFGAVVAAMADGFLMLSIGRGLVALGAGLRGHVLQSLFLVVFARTIAAGQWSEPRSRRAGGPYRHYAGRTGAPHHGLARCAFDSSQPNPGSSLSCDHGGA